MIARVIGERAKNSNIDDYLYPSLKQHLPEPLSIKDINLAIERTLEAITKNQTISLITDYDVDGSTSASCFIYYFRKIGIDVVHHTPERLQEGYGPNTKAVKYLKEEHNISLLFTLDCGTSSNETIDYANSLGIDTIVIDHHQPPDKLPDALAIINPQRIDDTSGLNSLAAVGVTFLFLVALNRKLRINSFFSEQKPEPNLVEILDLVALGTVCDMVPLLSTNRLLVKQGLKIIRNSKHLGLRALMSFANLRNYPSAKDLSFSIGPMINAASRMGHSKLPTQLMTSQDKDEANSIASTLLSLNNKRKLVEKNNLASAMISIDEDKSINDSFVHVADKKMHSGVAGIIASQLVAKHSLPTFVTAIDDSENNISKGSARSIPGFNISSCLQAGVQSEILDKAGGHHMAGGYSLHQDKIQDFHKFLQKYFHQYPITKDPTSIIVDYILPSFSKMSISDMSKNLAPLEPFGLGNPEPIILLQNVSIKAQIINNTNHLICKISPQNQPKETIRVTAFRSLGTPLGKKIINNCPDCHALVSLGSPSSYNKQPNINLIDIGWEL